MDPPQRFTQVPPPGLLQQGNQILDRALRKASTLTIVAAHAHGKKLLKEFPEIDRDYPQTLTSTDRCLALGFEDLRSPVTTPTLVTLSLEELGQLPLAKQPSHQLRITLKNREVFEHLSAENLELICCQNIPFFNEYIKPDDLPTRPFLALPTRKLAIALNYLKKKPERFPTLIGRIAKQLSTPLPQCIYEALPFSLRKNFMERPLLEEAPCAGWVAANLPMPKLLQVYRDALIALSRSISVQEQDLILLQLQKTLKRRSDADLAQLLDAYGFSNWTLALFPSHFSASLRLDHLTYSKWEKEKGFVKSSIADVFDPRIKGPEFITLLQKLNEPQLLYLYHLEILRNGILIKILGNASAERFILRYNDLRAKCLREYSKNYCTTPRHHESTEIVLKHFLSMQGNSKKYPSYQSLYDDTGSFFPESPQKVL